MESRLHRTIEKGLKPLSQLLPHNRAIDRLYHRLLFLWKHGRLPRRDALLWNDMWYRVKTTDEILDPLRVFVTDKEHVKSYVRQIAGDRYNVPTLAVLTTPRQVDEFEFPATCVIKPTHASHEVILRIDGAPVDLPKTILDLGITCSNWQMDGDAHFAFRPRSGALRHFVLHESVTTSVAATIRVLEAKRRQ